ncbi:hypothetical protein [Haloferula sp. A504]|uniref:hypothetical protein n=1 Tax=Haloferula sp. A504 TaxID=3373601 RepID=UPI0031C6CB92|nr:hypothetical protein [Verrucomicrobiaceae bacterium E54]
MQTPEEIEKALAERLIPRGFSERGGRELEALIDDLAAEEDPRRRSAWPIWGAAAAVAFVGSIAWWASPETAQDRMAFEPAGEELELISESVGVVTAEPDAELRSDDEGNLLRAWHVHVVSEERFRDAETGHEVRVVQPSDELVLLPVSTF